MAAGSSVANWALVVGIDRYWSDRAALRGAVRDALTMREWLLDTSGGGVPRENLVLVLGPRDGEQPGVEYVDATKDKIMVAVNDLMTLSGGKGDRFFFYYAGHGLTARVSGRDESALVASDFNAVNTDNSIALRSLWEFFETTQFADQFFFVDACRNIPWNGEREFEIGRWTLPRSRDAGVPPVQQFILYATSPGLKAAEEDDWGNERGAFTDALRLGLGGKDAAKAWSWSRGSYEVRWDRLVDYVKNELADRKSAVGGPDTFQVPQDAGSRGVAGRDRDPVVTSFAAGTFDRLPLEIELAPDTVYETGRVRVLNGIGDAVVPEVEARTGGRPVRIELDPGTYAVRAAAETFEDGRTEQPVELYAGGVRASISLLPQGTAAAADANAAVPHAETEAFGASEAPTRDGPPPKGRVTAGTLDPLALVDVRDNTGAVAAAGLGTVDAELDAGFYRIRVASPEAFGPDGEIALAPGEREAPTAPKPPPVDDGARRLATAFGGSVAEDGTVVPADGLQPLVAPQRTTILALAAEAAVRGEAFGAPLALDLPATRRNGATYVAVIADTGSPEGDVRALRVRLWAAGEPVPREATRAHAVGDGVGAAVARAARTGAHWLSLEHEDDPAVALTLTLLPRRPALVVVRHDGRRTRIFQYLLPRPGGEPAAAGGVRPAEHAQRLLLSGRLTSVDPLARQLAAAAADDPLAACLGGYVLLRLGLLDEVARVADAVIAVAPELADAYVLRGEAAAAAGDADRSGQAFKDAVAAGIPLFGEGLTRLIEGLRVAGFFHPRGIVVRHIFQRHLRGSMWSAFVPRPTGERLDSERLLVTGADTGFEA